MAFGNIDSVILVSGAVDAAPPAAGHALLLLMTTIGLLIILFLTMVLLMMIRRRRAAIKPAADEPDIPDAWEESARRLRVDDGPTDEALPR